MSGWAAADRATEFGLLAAMVDQPATLERVRERYAAWQEQLADEAADPVEATVARLAADGLWLHDLLGLAPPAGELREQRDGAHARARDAGLTDKSIGDGSQ